MEEKFHALNVYLKTFLISVIFAFFSFILLLPFAIFNYMEIPFGLILGEVISMLSYLIFGLIEKRGANDKKSIHMIVTVMISRVVILGLAIYLSALLYYHFHQHIFNVFAVVIGYLIPLAIFIILILKERKKDGAI